MTTVSLYRLHTDALDERTLQEIADRILERNPNQEVYIYDIERDEDEIGMCMTGSNFLYRGEQKHEQNCACGQCTGEDRAIEQMEKGICEAERRYGDD